MTADEVLGVGMGLDRSHTSRGIFSPMQAAVAAMHIWNVGGNRIKRIFGISEAAAATHRLRATRKLIRPRATGRPGKMTYRPRARVEATQTQRVKLMTL